MGLRALPPEPCPRPLLRWAACATRTLGVSHDPGVSGTSPGPWPEHRGAPMRERVLETVRGGAGRAQGGLCPGVDRSQPKAEEGGGFEEPAPAPPRHAAPAGSLGWGGTEQSCLSLRGCYCRDGVQTGWGDRHRPRQSLSLKSGSEARCCASVSSSVHTDR